MNHDAHSFTEHGALILVWMIVLLAAGEGRVAQAQSGGPPRVSILWPDSSSPIGTLYIKIKVDATSSGGSIARVQFLANNDLIGVVTNPPFNLLWTVGAGVTNGCCDTLVLSAVATDNLGLSATSAPVQLALYAGAPPGAILKITSPENGAVLAAPATFLLSAELLASMGETGPEEFFLGTNSLGVVNTNGCNETFTVATPPVSVTVSNLAEGSYQLKVRYLGCPGTFCFCDPISIRVVKLAAVSPRVEPDGALEFDVVTSFAGKQNVIEVSTNLQNWAPIATNQPANSTFTFTDLSPVAASNRFYRVLVPSQ